MTLCDTSELSHNKICNVEDFLHPALLPVIREVLDYEVVRFGPDFPAGRENRKDWEVAMAVRAFRDHGLLDSNRDFLGVAAGNEPTLFFLTRFARRVFATDLYLTDNEWSPFEFSSMVRDPDRHWPFEWNPRRLVVQHMDALDLRYEDESFDGIFSSSSIEHFGEYSAVNRSLDEMYRVLRPGGVLSVSTEFRIAGEPPGLPSCLMFDGGELMSIFVGERRWSLVSPLDLSVSEATLASQIELGPVVAHQLAQCDRHGGWLSFKLEYDHYPHVVMRQDDLLFTSVHLALRKE